LAIPTGGNEKNCNENLKFFIFEIWNEKKMKILVFKIWNENLEIFIFEFWNNFFEIWNEKKLKFSFF
jgi:hypothetical protein